MLAAWTIAVRPSLLTPACTRFRPLQATCIRDDAASQVGDVRAQPRTAIKQGVAIHIEEMDTRNIENDRVAVDGLAELLQDGSSAHAGVCGSE